MRRFGLYFSLAALVCLLTPAAHAADKAKGTANSAAPSDATPPVQEVSSPALAAKAPGAPGYGLQIATSEGKIMVTNLIIDPASKRPSFNLYRIHGPAGQGPYRAGIRISHHPASEVPVNHPFPAAWYGNYFNIDEILKGSAAEKAGLERDKYGLRSILSVDGKDFGWDPAELAYYVTNTPEIKVETMKIPLLFGGPSYRTFKIKSDKLATPIDPADGTFESLPPDKLNATIRAWVQSDQIWTDLFILRSKQERFAPLAIELDGRKLWVVYSSGAQSGPGTAPRYLEIWNEDPSTGHFKAGVLDVWPAPEDGMKTGRILRIGESWYRLKNFREDASTHRLTQFEVEAWSDVESLLSGKSPSEAMGQVNLAGARESLEEAANDILIEWKTRVMPGTLQKEQASALEDRVIHLEKSLLSLDLQVRHLHEQLDERARAKATLQAQAQMPGAPPPVAVPSANTGGPDLERLADVLSQRQAILQAILASTKQALAQVRR